jgi:hypothetical protein
MYYKKSLPEHFFKEYFYHQMRVGQWAQTKAKVAVGKSIEARIVFLISHQYATRKFWMSSPYCKRIQKCYI